VVSFTSRPLYPQGKCPWYPLDRRLGGLQSLSGRGGEEKNSQPLLGLEPPIIQPIGTLALVCLCVCVCVPFTIVISHLWRRIMVASCVQCVVSNSRRLHRVSKLKCDLRISQNMPQFHLSRIIPQPYQTDERIESHKIFPFETSGLEPLDDTVT
jgi:hypothetical protein